VILIWAAIAQIHALVDAGMYKFLRRFLLMLLSSIFGFCGLRPDFCDPEVYIVGCESKAYYDPGFRPTIG
jgi:hypothetical protein